MKIKLGKKLVNSISGLTSVRPPITLTAVDRSYIFECDSLPVLQQFFDSCGASHLLTPSVVIPAAVVESVAAADSTLADVRTASALSTKITAAAARAEAAASAATLAMMEARQVVSEISRLSHEAATRSARELLSARFASPYIYDQLTVSSMRSPSQHVFTAEERVYITGIQDLLGLASFSAAVSAVQLMRKPIHEGTHANILAKLPPLTVSVEVVSTDADKQARLISTYAADYLDPADSSDSFESLDDVVDSSDYLDPADSSDFFESLDDVVDSSDSFECLDDVVDASDASDASDAFESLDDVVDSADSADPSDSLAVALRNTFVLDDALQHPLSLLDGASRSDTEGLSILLSLMSYPAQHFNIPSHKKSWVSLPTHAFIKSLSRRSDPEAHATELLDFMLSAGLSLPSLVLSDDSASILGLLSQLTEILADFPEDSQPAAYKAPTFMWHLSFGLTSLVPC